MVQFETLTMTVQDGVARINLNRPDKANSIDGSMWRELTKAFDEVDHTDTVRVGVLGAAGKHFSTGIDLTFLTDMQQQLAQLAQGRRQEFLRQFIMTLQDSANAIERCRKPVLAAIQGFCWGAGVDIAAACDMRYATKSTRFSVKEVDLAIVADIGSLQRLPPIVGEGVARELAFTGRVFSGQEAQSMGFVNQVYADKDALDTAVMALAAKLAQKSPLALRGIKETLNYSRDHSVSDGLAYVAQRNAGMLLSQDLEEAIAAFLEKRKPAFEDG